ncbi:MULTISPECIES: hypothetical protein [Paenibacillus]|uniref:hypothetical protein n=1 Tax=Paenibacillus TaxID=44249 RepID=UPI00096EDA00|nr:hypothetical protein [Paenibacillus odorifer]OMD99932.1 hypothetical protein BSK60_33645 [Paenibacillus odorifer]
MPKFRKKPVEIEAVQFTGDNAFEIYGFMDKPVVLKTRQDHERWDNFERYIKSDGLKIYTLEGAMIASPGDFIIRGVKGEFYPCKPDIFVATYEAVEEGYNQ